MLADQLFHIPFFILPIHGTNSVLSVRWLQTLGAFLSDYNIPSIQFIYKNKPIKLTGSPSVFSTPATLAQFQRFIFTDSIASVHSITMSTIDNVVNLAIQSPTYTLDTSSLNPSLSTILQQFASVFSIRH